VARLSFGSYPAHDPYCRSGKTALNFAVENGKSDVADYLRSINAPFNGN
jgi:hypothetical protein